MSSTLAPATPPASSAGDVGGCTIGGPSANTRQVRLKVSYSFDGGNDSNYLARWPHPVNTPVVQVDRSLSVGVVEFKTCISSIISGSPELVARLGTDYSVYVYDYSEPEIPLVGCGMLSWAMLNTEKSLRRMVTGRVMSNAFMFLSTDDVKETLEVKIKLQKVDTITQEQFVDSVHTYQTLSKILPGDFDPSAWSRFVNANPRVLTEPLLQPLPPPPPPSGTTTEPDRPMPTSDWKDSSMSSSEEVVEPLKKKQRTTGKRPAKTYGSGNSKRKIASTSATPAATAEPTPEALPVLRESTESRQVFYPPRSRQSSLASQPSLAMSASNLTDFGVPSEVSPSPSNNMTSSPPTQSEAAIAPSPAPTSPCLPEPPRASLPTTGTTLDTLFEEPEVKDESRSDPVAYSAGGLLLPQPARAPNSLASPDDVTVSAAPSPEATQFAKVMKKAKRKPTLNKDSSPQLEAIAQEPVLIKRSGSVGAVKIMEKPKTTKPRTAAHVRCRIEKQLEEALKRGEMPNYCKNCGAIQTGVWRKVKVPKASEADQDKSKNDADGGEEEEILLCNACGLWFVSHKTMRPQALWETGKEEKVVGPKGRKRKKSAPAPTPPAWTLPHQSSEPCTEPVMVDADSISQPGSAVVKAITPRGDHSLSKETNVEWKLAIDAGRRTACSSPVIGSAESPIDLEEVDGMPSPKRRLFPDAKKSSPENPVGLPMPKRAPGKENKPPGEHVSAGTEIARPTTPKQKQPVALPLRSPGRSATKLFPQSSPCRALLRTPRSKILATPERRLLKSPQQRLSLSPVAGLLEKLLAENPDMMSNCGGLPALSSLDVQLPFDIDDDFLNTDYTMPSSPLPSSPPMGFNFYEDSADWSDFLPSTPNGGSGMNTNDILGGKDGPTVDLSAFIDEHSSKSGDNIPTSEAPTEKL